MENNEYIWYVCYGSNLLRERFMCYIEGRQITGADKPERGCKDTSAPKKDEPCIINNRLFFGYSANKWSGSSVAFIDRNPDANAKTYARKYLITKEQFFDVVRQENGLSADASIDLDENEIIKNKSVVLFPDNWYGRLLHINDLDDETKIPHYTFTSVEDPFDIIQQRPFGAYYDVIASGLKETHHLSDEEIRKYLSN